MAQSKQHVNELEIKNIATNLLAKTPLHLTGQDIALLGPLKASKRWKDEVRITVEEIMKYQKLYDESLSMARKQELTRIINAKKSWVDICNYRAKEYYNHFVKMVVAIKSSVENVKEDSAQAS